MVKSMFAAIAGLKTHQSRMDVISNNIANVNTWGFKTRSANFADAMYQNRMQGGQGYNVNGYSGGMNTSQLGFGVNLSSISTDFTTGSWSPTGNGLHCMINGPSFFIVGPFHEKVDNIKTGGVSLSRVGIFSVDSNGFLVDDQGNYVYGYACTNVGQTKDTNGNLVEATFNNGTKDANGNVTQKGTLTPIRIPSAEEIKNSNTQTDMIGLPTGVTGTAGVVDLNYTGDRAEFMSYTIGTDGTIVGITKDSKPYTLGKIAVANVQNPNGLEQDQGYLYNVGPNAGTVEHEEAGSDAVGKILSGYLEMANVDLANEIATMITTQRGYQANTKMITVTDEMLAELVNMKR